MHPRQLTRVGTILANRCFSVRDQRGAVLIMVAVGMVFLLGMAGLALDSGRGYLHRLRLTRAVDAAALTGARTLRAGNEKALAQAAAAAAANGLRDGVDAAALSLGISTNGQGESTFSATATQPIATFLMRIFGIDSVEVSAAAVAAVPPVDLVLVIDQSASLGMAGVWDELQLAAKDFVTYFSDSIDRMGLVSFQTSGRLRRGIGHDFTGPIRTTIDGMRSIGYTNYGEGLRIARDEITGTGVRDRSVKVVVFFTDGRPTAFRGAIGGRDRVMTVQPALPPVRLAGYYNNPDWLPSDGWGSVSGCQNVTYCWTWTEGATPHPTTADALNHDRGREMADQIRAAGAFLYTIGLGNPSDPDPSTLPNPDFLRELANEDGMTNPTQRAGRMYFAPSGAELRAVFNQVAQDLLVRLSR